MKLKLKMNVKKIVKLLIALLSLFFPGDDGRESEQGGDGHAQD